MTLIETNYIFKEEFLAKLVPKCPDIPNNQSKQTQTQLVFDKDQNNEGEAELKSWVLNRHESRDSQNDCN